MDYDWDVHFHITGHSFLWDQREKASHVHPAVPLRFFISHGAGMNPSGHTFNSCHMAVPQMCSTPDVNSLSIMPHKMQPDTKQKLGFLFHASLTQQCPDSRAQSSERSSCPTYTHLGVSQELQKYPMPHSILWFSLLPLSVTLSFPAVPVLSSLEVPVKPPLQMRWAFQPHPHHRLLKYWGSWCFTEGGWTRGCVCPHPRLLSTRWQGHPASNHDDKNCQHCWLPT